MKFLIAYLALGMVLTLLIARLGLLREKLRMPDYSQD
jgi:hypothetical protein